ncbi:3-oxo-5-alpha-steroid 4-dehydrogenase-domain-containing protein [Russula vinacea]|nr:3-oxo-5-alpha-steroid 4-dehydrogenase-domain-containing protein [Russula vinacea]
MTMAQYFALVKQIDFDYLYAVTKQWFFYGFALLGPAAFAYDAPFGSLPPPILPHPPPATVPLPPRPGPQTPFVLTALYLTHYLNRALISPLRSPSRSKSHLVVVCCAIAFNAPNGFLLAAYLTSASTAAHLSHAASSSPRFWAGLALWAAGFAGNVYHDEILLNIRRKAIAKGKAKELLEENGKPASAPRPHYAIPHGGLYAFISFPNYFCEWVEWFGFALAASPAPDFTLLPGAAAFPPWVFFFVEIITMRFKESYPRERRAVIPWLL